MPSADVSKTKRTDAVKNRERLVAAARQAFATEGPNVALEEIARKAEVSRATLYRNFDTRDELAAEVFEDNVRRIERRAREVAGRSDGIVTLFDDVVNMIMHDRSLVHALSNSHAEWFAGFQARTASAFESLLASGHAAKVVHSDVGVSDVLIALHMADVLAGRADTDPASVSRGHSLLHRALFTDRRELPAPPV